MSGVSSWIRIRRLAPREREVAELVYSRGEASATEICEALSEPLSNAAVRSMLGRLERKGLVRRRKEGRRYLYLPALADQSVREIALRRVSHDYFGGSLAAAAVALSDLARRAD